MVERIFDVHVLDKGYALWEGTLVSMTPATKHFDKRRKSRCWNEAVVDFFMIRRFRKEEVMNRREGKYDVELTFQPRKEFFPLVTIKQHHIAHSQLGSR